MSTAVLVLEDGSRFLGQAYGATGTSLGEAVFTTGMTGYQETITDPSYARQLVVQTAPHIGNTGVNSTDAESRKIWVAGYIVREPARRASNWRSEGDLETELRRQKIIGIHGVDTRAITRKIRQEGAMKAGIFSGEASELTAAEQLAAVQGQPSMKGARIADEVTAAEAYWVEAESKQEFTVAVIDLGIKNMTLRRFAERGVRVRVFPAGVGFSEIAELKPDGVFISNGPGDPVTAETQVRLVQQVLDAKIPFFGICFGNQILGRALGFSTYKLPFGHRGINQPVLDRSTGKVEITAQNHGFALDVPLEDPDSSVVAPEQRFGRVQVSHISLNDQVVEGLRCLDVPAFSVQYHPEAAAGPHDSAYLFDRFRVLMREASSTVLSDKSSDKTLDTSGGKTSDAKTPTSAPESAAPKSVASESVPSVKPSTQKPKPAEKAELVQGTELGSKAEPAPQKETAPKVEQSQKPEPTQKAEPAQDSKAAQAPASSKEDSQVSENTASTETSTQAEQKSSPAEEAAPVWVGKPDSIEKPQAIRGTDAAQAPMLSKVERALLGEEVVDSVLGSSKDPESGAAAAQQNEDVTEQREDASGESGTPVDASAASTSQSLPKQPSNAPQSAAQQEAAQKGAAETTQSDKAAKPVSTESVGIGGADAGKSFPSVTTKDDAVSQEKSPQQDDQSEDDAQSEDDFWPWEKVHPQRRSLREGEESQKESPSAWKTAGSTSEKLALAEEAAAKAAEKEDSSEPDPDSMDNPIYALGERLGKFMRKNK